MRKPTLLKDTLDLCRIEPIHGDMLRSARRRSRHGRITRWNRRSNRSGLARDLGGLLLLRSSICPGICSGWSGGLGRGLRSGGREVDGLGTRTGLAHGCAGTRAAARSLLTVRSGLAPSAAEVSVMRKLTRQRPIDVRVLAFAHVGGAEARGQGCKSR